MRYSDDGILELQMIDSDCVHPNSMLAITIHQANRLLREEQEKWQVVYGVPNEMFSHVEGTVYRNGVANSDTHLSRLMPPRPIQKDSFEQFVKDGLAYEAFGPEFAKRARKLLEEKK